ncbi:MAG: hypothetical protein ACJ73S_21045 [Mycobacteriales bacterium]
MPTRHPALALAAVTALVAAAGGLADRTADAAAGCLPSGTDATINAALAGANAQAVLCPGAVFTLTNPVTFTAPGQRLLTQGLPTDGTRAVLRVTGGALTTAINGNNQPGVVVENVEVDGNRPALGQLTGGALLEMGGAGTDQTVRAVVAHDTRSWSTVHLIEGAVTGGVPQCQRATVVDNTIGPAGTDEPAGTWADGISLACGDSLVANNTVQDATDGGIVIFGAPGSTVRDNRITAVSRQLLGGINLVDYAPMDGNYTGTVVTGNVIDGSGDLIKVGIAMGPQVWGCGTGTNHGASVTGNTVQGQNVAYGYAVNGVSDWTVTGNVDTARHVGALGGGCGGTPSRPGAFQYQAATASTLQPQFAAATLTYVLGVSEPGILRAAGPVPGCRAGAGQGLYPGQAVTSCDGRFTLALQQDGNLVLRQGDTALWSTGTTGRAVPTATAIMQGDGNFVLYDAASAAVWASGTSGQPGADLVLQDDGTLVVYSPAGVPLWASNTCCH